MTKGCLLLVLFSLLSHQIIKAQDAPCRDWYYITDANGNKIKDKCKEGWQENANGQKHGLYFENFKDGTPSIRAHYKNDQLNGKYIEYSKDVLAISTTLRDSGQYINGRKIGKWFFQPDYYVSYQNGKPVGKSTHKYESIILEGSIDSQGLYNGKAIFHFNGYFGKSTILGLPAQECEDALRLSPVSSSFIETVFSKYGKETHLASNAQNIDIICQIISGNIAAIEKCSVMIDHIAKPEVLSEAFTTALIKNHEHPETNFYTKASEKAKVNSDSSLLVQYLKNYPKGLYIAEVRNQLRGMRAALADKNSTSVDESFSPTFKNDSYELDDNGKIAIRKLRSYLEKINPEGIKHLIFIGHAAADVEFGRYSFNPKEYAHPINAKGQESSMGEDQLAQLRVILSLGRLKSVYKELESLSIMPKLIETRNIWLLPAGDEFGKEISTKKRNQNIVQVVVITHDNREINTELEVLPYGNEFKSDMLKRINQRIGDCGFNFSCFVPKYLGVLSFGKLLPDYIPLTLNSNDLAHFMNTVNQNCRDY